LNQHEESNGIVVMYCISLKGIVSWKRLSWFDGKRKSVCLQIRQS